MPAQARAERVSLERSPGSRAAFSWEPRALSASRRQLGAQEGLGLAPAVFGVLLNGMALSDSALRFTSPGLSTGAWRAVPSRIRVDALRFLEKNGAYGEGGSRVSLSKFSVQSCQQGELVGTVTQCSAQSPAIWLGPGEIGSHCPRFTDGDMGGSHGLHSGEQS